MRPSRKPPVHGKAARQAPRLSLCMIVRNEAATLEQCLRLARPHVDEVVVIDTGSTDGTQDIARLYADVFEEIVWPDSFSLARNHSFDRATGDYLLVLDGDEYLPDTAQWGHIRAILLQEQVAAVQLLVRNLMPEGQVLAADRMWQERIFRNHPLIRYQGRVHNQIQEGLLAYMRRTGDRMHRVEAEIIHTGYALSAEKMKAKYTTRIHLLRAEYEMPRSAQYQAYYGYQLGVVYFVLKEYAEAARLLDELAYQHLSPQNAFYTHLLAAQAHLKCNEPVRSLVHCNAMLTLDRTEPIAYYATGLALLMARQVGDGLLMLLEASRINDAAGTGVRFVLNPRFLLQVLARSCRQVGLLAQAERFEALHDRDTYPPEVVRALIEKMKLGLVQAERQAA